MGSEDVVVRSLEPDAEPVPEAEGGSAFRRAWFEQLSDDRYGVFVGDRRIGFIDVDGPLHVALRGEAYETAVEVDRAIRFDQALRALLVA
ncbi:hypothetical protein KXS11_08515 [Plantibacter flavus]|uniref:hypothetical protein n=1 Tax=Plantibacter flavus TaxID=150123 RepID=UPI003F18ACBA